MNNLFLLLQTRYDENMDFANTFVIEATLMDLSGNVLARMIQIWCQSFTLLWKDFRNG